MRIGRGCRPTLSRCLATAGSACQHCQARLTTRYPAARVRMSSVLDRMSHVRAGNVEGGKSGAWTNGRMAGVAALGHVAARLGAVRGRVLAVAGHRSRGGAGDRVGGHRPGTAGAYVLVEGGAERA